ncbi:hypothetical protein KHA80_07810 [Anaerobacillus sp. HL2]|nr:hypothetical protein KHA80_07810 [Anaerobacillus sp. HL2]
MKGGGGGGVFIMIVSHDFGIGLVEYAENEKSNDYPANEVAVLTLQSIWASATSWFL